MSDKFIKLNSKLTISNEILEFALLSDIWYHTNGFDVSVVPDSILENDPQLQKIIREFSHGGKIRAIVIKIKPMTFYSMHVDEVRAAALNVLLKGKDSISFFGNATQDPETFDIDVVDYQKDEIFLFNTQKLHGVLNLSQERYVFSLGFNFPFNYDTIKEFCLENNL